jgi:hypothetical protein
LSAFKWIPKNNASLNLVHVAAFAVMGMWESTCLDWPSDRMSLTREEPTFFSFESVELGRR